MSRYSPLPRIGAIVVSLMLTGPVVAQAPDLSTPQSTARSMYEAVERADADAIRRVLYAQDDAERDLVDAYVTLILSGKRLADAAQKRYGDAADAIARGALPSDAIRQLENATVRESDDSATLRAPGMHKPMKLRRTDAGWQIVLTDGSTDVLPGQAALMRRIAAAFGESADEIDSGKHATVPDAEAAIQQRLNDAITQAVRENLPTSAPTTAPARP